MGKSRIVSFIAGVFSLSAYCVPISYSLSQSMYLTVKRRGNWESISLLVVICTPSSLPEILASKSSDWMVATDAPPLATNLSV